MAELADALGLDPNGSNIPCEFNSRFSHITRSNLELETVPAPKALDSVPAGLVVGMTNCQNFLVWTRGVMVTYSLVTAENTASVAVESAR